MLSASQVQTMRPRMGEPWPEVTELETQKQDEHSRGLGPKLSLNT